MRAISPQATVHSIALLHLLAAHAANLSLRHGSRGAAAMSYALLGIACAARDDGARAAALGDVALRLVEGTTPPVPGRYRAPVLLVAGAFLAPLTRPLRAGLADLHAAFDAAQRQAIRPLGFIRGFIEGIRRAQPGARRRSSLGTNPIGSRTLPSSLGIDPTFQPNRVALDVPPSL